MNQQLFRTLSEVAAAIICVLAAGAAQAQPCPEKNIIYWQAFPAGGESDIAGRHQQVLLKKRSPKIEMVMQYKPGAGGGLLWGQLNGLPGDGYNIAGVNLPHIFLQPLEGDVQYKTEDITPVYWFHYTPDAIIVANDSPIKTFQDLIRMAKAQPGKLTLAGSGLNSANHVAHEKLDGLAGIHHQHDAAGRLQGGEQLFQRVAGRDVLAGLKPCRELLRDRRRPVEHSDREPVVRHVQHQAATHGPQADEPDVTEWLAHVSPPSLALLWGGA